MGGSLAPIWTASRSFSHKVLITLKTSYLIHGMSPSRLRIQTLRVTSQVNRIDVYLPAGDCRNPFAVAHRQSERALPAQKLWTHHSVEYRDRQVGLSYNARDCFVCNVYASLPGKRLCDCSNSSNPSAVVATSPASRPANASNSSQVSNRRNHPNTLSRARQTPTSPASKQSAHPSTAALGSVRYRADSASRCPQTCNTGTACPATQEKAHRTLA
jgi:hypothetical protein